MSSHALYPREGNRGRASAYRFAAAAAFVCAALLLRFAWTGPGFVITRDSTEYLRAAVAVEKQGFGSLKTSLRQPLFPAAIWAAGTFAGMVDSDFAWSGQDIAEAGRWLNFALYVPFLIAAWALFKRVAGYRYAFACILVATVHPLFGPYFANVLSETLYLTFFLSALYCMVGAFTEGRAQFRRSIGWGLAGGAAAGLAYLTRVEGQVLVFAGVLWAAKRLVRKGKADERTVHVWPALALLAGFMCIALPAALYFGASAQRYPWEWVFEKITARSSGAAPAAAVQCAGLQLAAAPLNSAWMLAWEFLTRAPVIAAAFMGALLHSAGAIKTFVKGFRLPPVNRPLMLSAALYAALIVAGVSLRNGVVSQRYIQPLVLMMLPAAMLFLGAVLGNLHLQLKPGLRRWALPSAVLLVFCASFSVAVGRWGDRKVGYRRTGAEIARAAPEGAILLTSSPRLAFYAGGIPGVQAPALLEESILAGDAALYDFAALETRHFTGRRLEKMAEALAGQGFPPSPWLDVAEYSRGKHPRRRILVFKRDVAHE